MSTLQTIASISDNIAIYQLTQASYFYLVLLFAVFLVSIFFANITSLILVLIIRTTTYVQDYLYFIRVRKNQGKS